MVHRRVVVGMVMGLCGAALAAGVAVAERSWQARHAETSHRAQLTAVQWQGKVVCIETRPGQSSTCGSPRVKPGVRLAVGDEVQIRELRRTSQDELPVWLIDKATVRPS